MANPIASGASSVSVLAFLSRVLDHEHENRAGEGILEQAWKRFAFGVSFPADGEQAGETIDRSLVSDEMIAALGQRVDCQRTGGDGIVGRKLQHGADRRGGLQRPVRLSRIGGLDRGNDCDTHARPC
jgi:hypothetical protein